MSEGRGGGGGRRDKWLGRGKLDGRVVVSTQLACIFS